MSQVDVIDPIGEGFRTYLLKVEGDVVASARTSKAPTGGRLVSDVWTSPKHRGQGYSKRVLNTIFGMEPRPLKLRVGAYGDGKKLTNEQLKEYYNRLGFTKPEGDLLVKAANCDPDMWTSDQAELVERLMQQGVQMDRQVDKQAGRLPWQTPLPVGPMNDQPIVQLPWWRARPGEKTLGDAASDVAGAGRKVVQVARNLVPRFQEAPMARGPYTPNSNRVDVATMALPTKQSAEETHIAFSKVWDKLHPKEAVVRRKGKKWQLWTADGSRVLGTHDTAQDAYKQEYAIQKSKERAAKSAALQSPQMVDALSQLMEARRESDRRNYKRKHSILRRLIEDNPDAFSVDSMSRGIAGLTHNPTGFRLHMPGTAVPSSLMAKTSAVERVPQKKRRPWWLAPAGTMAAGYGMRARKEEERKKKARPQLRLFPAAQAKAATYTTNAPGPMPAPMDPSEYRIPRIVRAVAGLIPPRPVDAPSGKFGAPPGYATQAAARVQANMPFGTGWMTSGHTADFMKHYSALTPPLQRQVDQAVGNTVRAYNGNPIPPLDFAMRARENYPAALTHDRVADVYEKDPVAAARMANGLFQGASRPAPPPKPAPPVWTAPRTQSMMVKSQAWWLQKPANSFSRALALESIPDSVKRKFDAKAEKADGVTAEELVWYAHNIAHKVDNNLENGHGHVTPPGSEKKLEKAALTAAEVAEAGKVVPKRMSMAVRSSGNYKKGIVTWNGLRISIETPAGHWRIGKKEDGKLWFTKMRDAYGYIQRHEGYDGDAVDVFLGPDLDSPWVHVVNQTDGKSNTFDEVKCVIGCHTEAEARLLYMRNYNKGWRGYRSCVRMSVEQFKNWLPKAKDGPASHSQLKAAAVRGAAPQLRGVGAQKLAAFLAPLAISAGGLGTDLITNAYSRRAADRLARALGPMPREEKAVLDLQARLRTVPVAGLRSPAYISYRDIENRAGVPLGEREPEEKHRRGMVVYDPKTTPTAYYAHELGHADVPMWARSDKFTPRALTTANVFSYFPGAAYGAWSGRPVVGAAVGALGRLIGRSPMIVEEYFAMRRANQMIDALPGTPEDKQAHKAALMRAFLTYVIPPAASGAAVGSIAGMAGMLKGK